MVTCAAGSILLFNHNAFHGNYPNVGSYARESLQLSYRPSWAGPTDSVVLWDPVEVAKLPEAVQSLMGDRSARIWVYEGGNKLPDMPCEASGMDPSRWERD